MLPRSCYLGVSQTVEGMFYTLTKTFKALSDPTRLSILILLPVRPHCVCELAQILEISQPSISKHLQILLDAGFITFKKKKTLSSTSLSPRDDFIKEIFNLCLGKAKGSVHLYRGSEEDHLLNLDFSFKFLKG